jgi:hypothetical protein
VGEQNWGAQQAPFPDMHIKHAVWGRGKARESKDVSPGRGG